MKRLILLDIAMIIVYASCDRQRDLYDISSPFLSVEGDWVPSFNKTDMSQNATAMIYNNTTVVKEYFLKPNMIKTPVTKGKYYILLFNGMMFSEDNTNLDDIYFRETNDIYSFEAFTAEGESNKKLLKWEGEVIASNEMEILTSQIETIDVEDESHYYSIYKNGEKTNSEIPAYADILVKMTPKPVSYNFRIILELVNPRSAVSATGALRGFAGSVNMASRIPSHREVSYHLKLNNLQITQRGTPGDPENPEIGTIETPSFVTFGPPVNLPDRKYEFEVIVLLKDGREMNRVFDITGQVNPLIETIKKNFDETFNSHIKYDFSVFVSTELPEVDSDSGSNFDVGAWEKDEIIRIPIIN